MVEERYIDRALAAQRPPRKPPNELPTCPASELCEPTSYAEATASPQAEVWHEAMEREFSGLSNAKTFEAG